MSDTGTTMEHQVSGSLPEGYVEEFEKGMRDYFEGFIPPHITVTDIKQAALTVYHKMSEKRQPSLAEFRHLATFSMLVIELKKAGFDSLETHKDVRRSFRSFKFRRYLRKMRKQARAHVRKLDTKIDTTRSQIKTNDMKIRKNNGRANELQSTIK